MMYHCVHHLHSLPTIILCPILFRPSTVRSTKSAIFGDQTNKMKHDAAIVDLVSLSAPPYSPPERAATVTREDRWSCSWTFCCGAVRCSQ